MNAKRSRLSSKDIDGGMEMEVDHSTPAFPSNSRLLPEVIKSPADVKREYRAIKLANEMTVLLVSDPQTDKSAAALNVLTGSMSDPEELPGLAHYLEHMLFLGTEKFPEENDYAKYLAQHAGTSNAYTAGDNTCYYFESSPEGLDGALDRFAQFFIAPLFTESCNEREVNAVNSEHEGNIPDDDTRKNRIDSFLTESTHPYGRFKTGNKNTLWTLPMENSMDVRAELLKFYENHYSANIMNLAVIGRESLDLLQSMVEKYFSPIRNTNVQLSQWPESPYGSNELQTRIDIVPIMDVRELSLVFPIPDYTKHYKTGSCSYLKCLIGHEGPGSLLSLLKKKKWVTDLSVWSDVPARGFAFLGVDISMTPDGLKHMNQIVEHIFQYIEMLRQVGPKPWFWEEIKTIKETAFRYMEDQSADYLVVDLVDQMGSFPVNEIYTSRFILSDYQPQLISHIASCLVPENVRIITQSKENREKATEKEIYYGIKYCYSKISSNIIQAWKNCGLHEKISSIPLPNTFIPTNFDIKPRDKKTGVIPRIISDDDISRVWFLQDNEFLLPRAYITLDIFSPYGKYSPKNYNLQALFENVADDLLTEYTYSASRAGLSYSIDSTLSGLRITVRGYDHKVSILFDYILQFLVNFSSAGDRFEDTKEAYIRDLKNWADKEPCTHANDYMNNLLSSHAFTNDELLAELNDLTAENLVAYTKLLFNKVRLQWFICGNMTEDEALSLHEAGLRHFKLIGTESLFSSQLAPSREVNLPIGCNYLYKVEHQTHSNSCVHLFLQNELGSLRDSVILKLIEHVLSESCFDILRTKEQLGYFTDCSVRKSRGVLGLEVIVQGEKHPNFLESRIHNFLQLMTTTVNNLTLDEFTKYKNSLHIVIAEKPKTLNARARFIDLEIVRRTYNFDRQNLKIKELEDISMAEVKQFFNKWISPKAPGRKLLSVHVLSMAKRGAGLRKESTDEETFTKSQVLVDDIIYWKSKLGYYPAQKPFGSIPCWKKKSSKLNSKSGLRLFKVLVTNKNQN